MLTDMIVKSMGTDADGELNLWHISRGSRSFLVVLNPRGEWNTVDATGDLQAVLDVSGDLSGSLEYIESLFN